MKLKTGDLLCIERKRKDKKKNKWQRWSFIYIVLNENKAMGFRAKKPIEIDLTKEKEKGCRIQKITANISYALKCWNVDFDTFNEAFFSKVGD